MHQEWQALGLPANTELSLLVLFALFLLRVLLQHLLISLIFLFFLCFIRQLLFCILYILALLIIFSSYCLHRLMTSLEQCDTVKIVFFYHFSLTNLLCFALCFESIRFRFAFSMKSMKHEDITGMVLISLMLSHYASG